jgi:hypothetical protein
VPIMTSALVTASLAITTDLEPSTMLGWSYCPQLRGRRCLVVLLRLAYLGVTNAVAMLRLLPMSDRAKDAEILALRHQVMILERQLHGQKIRFTPVDRALLAALLHRLPRSVLRRIRLLVRPETVLRLHGGWHLPPRVGASETVGRRRQGAGARRGSLAPSGSAVGGCEHGPAGRSRPRGCPGGAGNRNRPPIRVLAFRFLAYAGPAVG